MQRIRVVVMFSVLGLMGLAQAAQPQAGLVERLPDGDVLLYFAQPLDRRQPVFVQRLADGGRLQCCDRVDARRAKREAKPITDVSGAMDAPIYAYRLRSDKPGLGSGQDWEPYVGVALSAAALAPGAAQACGYRVAPLVTADQKLQAYLCWGQEGVNLLSRSPQGWQRLYFGFHYALTAKPRCDAQDTQRMLQAGG